MNFGGANISTCEFLILFQTTLLKALKFVYILFNKHNYLKPFYNKTPLICKFLNNLARSIV